MLCCLMEESELIKMLLNGGEKFFSVYLEFYSLGRVGIGCIIFASWDVYVFCLNQVFKVLKIGIKIIFS